MGTLADHLDKNASTGGGPPISRCEWNLYQYRIREVTRKLKADGFVNADSTAARVVSELRLPEVAVYGPTGKLPVFVTGTVRDPAHWPRIWWVRRWARAIGEVSTWPMTRRRQVIRELAASTQDCRDVVESTYLLAGSKAVEQLGPEIIAPRCGQFASQGKEPCVLADDHPGGHRGTRGHCWGRWQVPDVFQ